MAAEDAGSIEAELRLKLTQMEKDALEAQKKMDALAAKMKAQGQTAGKGFAGGMKQGFDQVETSAAKMGRSIATKLSPAIIGITVGIKAIQGLGSAIGNAFMANEKFAKGISDLKSSLGASFTAATKPVTDWFANLIEKAARSVRQTNELRAALKRIRDENYGVIGENLASELNNARTDVEAIERRIAEINENVAKAYGRTLREAIRIRDRDLAGLEADLIRAQEKLNNLLEQTGNANVESLSKLQEIENEYMQTLKAIEYQKAQGAMSQQERDEAAVSALNNYINKTAELLALGQEGEIQGSVYNQRFNERIAERIALQERLKESEITDQEKITEARLTAIEKYEQAVRRARDAREAGLINEEEMERQIHAALEQKYSDLESIVTQYKLTTGETIRLRDETAELVRLNQEIAKAKEYQKNIDAILLDQGDELRRQEIDMWRTKAASAKSEAERVFAINKAIELENELIDIQRERAWKAIEESEAFINASDEEREAILDNFDRITAGMKKVREEAEKDLKEGFFSEIYSQTLQLGEAVIGAYDNISNSLLEISRKHAEEQIAIIEKALEVTLENIEKAREAALIANGFAVANNEESLEAQLEAAKRTGDEILIYQAQRRLEEQRINDEYDEQAKQAAEQAAKEKAKIEYDLAVQEFNNKMISAANAGIMAVLQALASAPPPYNIILAGISGAATAVQIGLLAANPPKPPQFATGGIVPGNSYVGDKVPAMVNSGELILNRSQQDRIAGQLTSNNGPVTATIVVMMDTREIAKSTVDLVNDGFYTIKARALK